MNKFLTLICMSIFAAPALHGADEKAAPVPLKTKAAGPAPSADAKNKSPEEGAAVVLKTKSAFTADASMRNPFWPISYKPTGHVAGGGGGTDQGEVPPGAFVVSSITLDERGRFAIINGKSMSEGMQFGLQVGTQVYQVSVKRIEDGRVILGRHDEEIVVPLRRK
jgi:hypothetical protein